MTLSDDQLESIPAEAQVRVHAGDLTWRAVVSSLEAGETGETVLVLTGKGGGPVCGRQCGQVGTDGPQRLRATVVVVPRTSGPIVPAAALHSDADGNLFVTTTSREQRPVTVLAADGGQAVVDGVDAGTQILLFGQDEASGS